MTGTTRRFAALAGAAVLVALGTGAVPAPAGGASPAVVVYDAYDDYSMTTNPGPGGNWRYGYTPTLGGALTLFETFGATGEIEASWTRPYAVDPNVNRSRTGEDVVVGGGGIYFPVGFVHIHPGPYNERAVVRFTAPQGGSYLVAAIFKSLRILDAPTTTDVHVLVNSTPVFNEFINGFMSDGTKDYSTTLRLAAGDTVDFAVGFGQNGNYYCDSTGVKATITFLDPDPATLLGLLQGTVGGLSIDAGVKSSLASKIDQVAKLLAAGNEKAAANVLGAFLNEVSAQKGKKIDAAAADSLAATANAVLGLLSTK